MVLLGMYMYVRVLSGDCCMLCSWDCTMVTEVLSCDRACSKTIGRVLAAATQFQVSRSCD